MSNMQSPFKGQKILFHFSFSHYTGTYKNEGWFIDCDGKIKTYSIGENGVNWNFPEEEAYTEKRLLDNYSFARETESELSQVDLKEMYELIHQSKEGPYTDTVFADSEKGSASFYCFDFDPGKKVYRRVVLNKSGDFSQKNMNEKAKKLYQRLIEINKFIKKSFD